jgi:hypothetical protein
MSSGSFKAATPDATLSGKPGYQPLSLNFGASYRF